MEPPEEFDGAAAAAQLRGFLATHDEVWLREQGAVVARLRAADSGYAVATEHGKLVCHFWTPEANVVRRVVGLEGGGRDGEARLRLQCLRLGRTRPALLVLEAAGAAREGAAGGREEFRAAMVAAALREWPGWRLEGRAAGAGALQHFLLGHKGRRRACAALAESDGALPAESALAAALAWAEQQRLARPERPLAGLHAVLPATHCAELAARLPWLRGGVPVELHTCDAGAGLLASADEAGGNLESSLGRAPNLLADFPPFAMELLAATRELAAAAVLDRGGDGAWQLRLHGLAIARQAVGFEAGGAEAVYGAGAERSPLDSTADPLWQAFLRDVAGQRRVDGSAGDPWFRFRPEAWMEDKVRSDLLALEPRAEPRFMYRQVPACRAGRRDVLDLLGVTREGRLLVIELKAGEDAGFPLQALDYWLRVRHHLEAGDFERMGYFPGMQLSRLAPRLLLVAPALRWHPHTPHILRWLSPEVPLERLGVNEDWRRKLEVVARW